MLLDTETRKATWLLDYLCYPSESQIYKATIDIEIRRMEGEFETVDHRLINAYEELSIVGDITGKHQRNPWACGQVKSILREMVPCSIEGDERAWSDGERQLLDIWDRWHLNGMKAPCIHQGMVPHGKPYGVFKVYAAEETAKCPKGYRWGSKWLVEELDPNVLHWFTNLTGDGIVVSGKEAA